MIAHICLSFDGFSSFCWLGFGWKSEGGQFYGNVRVWERTKLFKSFCEGLRLFLRVAMLAKTPDSILQKRLIASAVTKGWLVRVHYERFRLFKILFFCVGNIFIHCIIIPARMVREQYWWCQRWWWGWEWGWEAVSKASVLFPLGPPGHSGCWLGRLARESGVEPEIMITLINMVNRKCLGVLTLPDTPTPSPCPGLHPQKWFCQELQYWDDSQPHSEQTWYWRRAWICLERWQIKAMFSV